MSNYFEISLNFLMKVLFSITGALYLDGTMGPFKKDDMVPAGHHHLYIWNITYNFAPAKDDPGCISWAYHSHVFTTRDANSGAIGCLVTCKAGKLTGPSLTLSTFIFH